MNAIYHTTKIRRLKRVNALLVGIIAGIAMIEIPWVNDRDDFFASHNWQCSTDDECLAECLALAKVQSIDSDICADIDD